MKKYVWTAASDDFGRFDLMGTFSCGGDPWVFYTKNIDPGYKNNFVEIFATETKRVPHPTAGDSAF